MIVGLEIILSMIIVLLLIDVSISAHKSEKRQFMNHLPKTTGPDFSLFFVNCRLLSKLEVIKEVW